jgi:ArsR family transcriptional regulator
MHIDMLIHTLGAIEDVMKLATEEFDRISKALADPQRREILQKLTVAAKLNCSDIHSMFEISQPTVSHHLKELAIAGIVDKEKKGQFCYYHVNSEVLSSYVTELQRRLGLDTITVAPRLSKRA